MDGLHETTADVMTVVTLMESTASILPIIIIVLQFSCVGDYNLVIDDHTHQ